MYLQFQVLNFHEAENEAIPRIVKIGEFGEQDGLVLNASAAISYDGFGKPRPMSDVRSKCSEGAECQSARKPLEPVVFEESVKEISLPKQESKLAKVVQKKIAQYAQVGFGIFLML